jgi:hypothetical protein
MMMILVDTEMMMMKKKKTSLSLSILIFIYDVLHVEESRSTFSYLVVDPATGCWTSNQAYIKKVFNTTTDS